MERMLHLAQVEAGLSPQLLLEQTPVPLRQLLLAVRSRGQTDEVCAVVEPLENVADAMARRLPTLIAAKARLHLRVRLPVEDRQSHDLVSRGWGEAHGWPLRRMRPSSRAQPGAVAPRARGASLPQRGCMLPVSHPVASVQQACALFRALDDVVDRIGRCSMALVIGAQSHHLGVSR